MATLTCKMCGGDLSVSPGESIAVCDYCGTQQTLPRLDDDRRANAFNRANHFRRQSDFDKAVAAYERILAEDESDAEAHWGIVLSRFGIEYVEDPASHERIPTCHRVQIASVLTDADYLVALENARDISTRELYEKEAKRIAEIQKGILAISSREKPYNVFICYKETDASGARSKDSAIAQDVYYQLVNEGYSVFFSRITLEDKLGQEYEPYIFAALNSAKVMVVIGTSHDNFNAVWVKNEWSRYLDLMKQDKSRLLIPCYRDMDAYDIPDELSMLQSQDMSKIGFIQDLVRGIKRVLSSEEPKASATPNSIVSAAAPGVVSLLKRAFIFLEDEDWNSANEYCEKVLDIDPENVMAYVGKLCSELRAKSVEGLAECEKPLDGRNNYQKAIRFADVELKTLLEGYNAQIIQTKNNSIDEAVRVVNTYVVQHCDKQVKRELAQAESRIRISEKKRASIISELSSMNHAELLEQEKMLAASVSKQQQVVSQYRAQIKEYNNEISTFGAFTGKQKKELKHRVLDLEATLLPLEAELKSAESKERAIRNKTGKYNVLNQHKISLEESLGTLLSRKEILKGKLDLLVGSKSIEEYEFKKAVAFLSGNSRLDSTDIRLLTLTADITTGEHHTVALNADGTVVAVGQNDCGQRGVSDWTNIVAVAAGSFYTVGLRVDGTVMAVGQNGYGQCGVSGWTNIVAVSAGDDHTVGLKSDGTAVAVGKNYAGKCEVWDWKDMVAISAGGDHTVGLKAEGTVVAVGWSKHGRCKVSDWVDIVAISAGKNHTIGLKADGTVLAVGDNDSGQCNVSDWTDIIAVSAGKSHTLGLKADGTVVAVGDNDGGQLEVSGWTDIITVSAGGAHTAGLKADGTVVVVGRNEYGQCAVARWN